jgi:hypothetical protein
MLVNSEFSAEEGELMSVAANHGGEIREYNEAKIEKEASIRPLVSIAFQALLYRRVASPSIHLRPACDSRLQPAAVGPA